MNQTRIREITARLAEADGNLAPEVYLFIREALARLAAAGPGERGHVSARELLGGFRDLAIEQFGPMSRVVLEEWGVESPEDVGRAVYQMIDAGVLGRSEKDSPEDFKNAMDFDTAFAP